MKPFIISLYVIFIIAMVSGLMAAYRNAESLVEPDYYRKQNDWFRQKSEERRLGIDIRPPASLSTGRNEVRFVLTEQGEPLRNTRVTLFIGNVAGSDHDLACTMHETDPGVYIAQASVPSTGKWMVRVELENNHLKTGRSWFYDIR